MIAAPIAGARELTIRGSRRIFKITGEPGVLYHPVGIGRPLEAIVHGPGKVKVGLRAQVAEGGNAHVAVRILIDGAELFDITLRGEAVARFVGHHPTAAGGRVERPVHVGGGSHTVTVDVRGGSAVASFEFVPARPGALALAPLAAEPLALVPLAPAPLTPPAPAPAPLLTPPPPAAQAPLVAETPAPKSPVSENRKSSTASSSGSGWHWYALGAGGVLAVAGGALVVAGNGTYGSYAASKGNTPNREGMRSTASTEMNAGIWVGVAALVALAVGTVSFTF